MRALFRRYPKLAITLPRVDLRVRETPLERWDVGGTQLLIKRDDLTSSSLGGNKARALELLLAEVGPNDTLLTVGSEGSTHALAVAHYANRLSARVEVISWPQESNAVAKATRSRISRLTRVTRAKSVVGAYLHAALRRLRDNTHWIPAGGSSALGALAHVNAAVELLAQLDRQEIPHPKEIVAPLGSGGTAAGLLVGLAILNSPIRLIGVRVVPRTVGNRWRVLRLARKAHRLLEQRAGVTLPRLNEQLFEIDHSAFGGAYARETVEAEAAATLLKQASGPQLDGTYSAKAFGVALERARHAPDGQVLFWLTFDGRWLATESGSSTRSRK